jgi:hypothetical protein
MTAKTLCPRSKNAEEDNPGYLEASTVMAQEIFDDQAANERITRKFELIFMAADIATALRPDVTIYNDEFDFRPSATGIRPVLANIAVSSRDRVLISASITGDVPTVAEVRLIVAALEMMEKD